METDISQHSELSSTFSLGYSVQSHLISVASVAVTKHPPRLQNVLDTDVCFLTRDRHAFAVKTHNLTERQL